jgi:hypothetical protein
VTSTCTNELHSIRPFRPVRAGGTNQRVPGGRLGCRCARIPEGALVAGSALAPRRTPPRRGDSHPVVPRGPVAHAGAAPSPGVSRIPLVTRGTKERCGSCFLPWSCWRLPQSRAPGRANGRTTSSTCWRPTAASRCCFITGLSVRPQPPRPGAFTQRPYAWPIWQHAGCGGTSLR